MLGSGVPTPPPLADEHWFVYPPTSHPSATTAAQALTILVGAGEERRAVNLELHPVPTVRASDIVIGPDGPADGILVQLIPNGAADVGLDQDAPTTGTDGNGAFTFPSVPAGLYSLRAAMASPREAGTGAPIERPLWSNVPVGVGQNDIDDFVIVLQAGIRISGRLEFEGIGPKPPTGLQQVPLVIEPDDSTPVIPIPKPPARVESSGQFTTAPLAGGRYFVRVAGSPVGWMFKAAMYDGRDVSETPLELEAGDVSGLPPRRYTLTAAKDGYVTANYGSKRPGRAGRTIALLDRDPHGYASHHARQRYQRHDYQRSSGPLRGGDTAGARRGARARSTSTPGTTDERTSSDRFDRTTPECHARPGFLSGDSRHLAGDDRHGWSCRRAHGDRLRSPNRQRSKCVRSPLLCGPDAAFDHAHSTPYGNDG